MVRSDEDLLAAWRDGDSAAGQDLYARYFPIVYRFFSNKIGDDIEDLVQRTFLSCTRYRDRLRELASFRAFILTVARNELFDHLRRRYRGGETIDVFTLSMADLGASPSQLIARRDEHRMLLLALRKLTIDLQEVLELSYFEKLSGRELAHVLEIPEGTVRSRLRRALEALRVELGRMEQSPDQIESTISSLSDWAAEIRSLTERDLTGRC